MCFALNSRLAPCYRSIIASTSLVSFGGLENKEMPKNKVKDRMRAMAPPSFSRYGYNASYMRRDIGNIRSSRVLICQLENSRIAIDGRSLKRNYSHLA